MKRPTLQEYLQAQQNQQQEPQDEPKSLSPIHFRGIAKDAEEMDAYNAAYQEFLKYYKTDPERRDAFGKKLHDALFNRDTDRLMSWYSHYSWLNYK